VGFVVDKVVLGQVSSEYLSFLCQFSFIEMFHSNLSSRAGTIDQLVANVPSGLSLTLPHPKRKNPSIAMFNDINIRTNDLTEKQKIKELNNLFMNIL
jgi:hypothetical protein